MSDAYTIPNGSITGSSFVVNAALDAPINGVQDADFFKFTLSETTHVTALSSSGTDTYGYILSSTGSVIASNDDGYLNPSNGLDFVIRSSTLDGSVYYGVMLQPGTYYIKVTPYSSYTTLGAYQLRLVGGDYTWSQGQGAVNLGSYTNRMCYLTGVAGKFMGGGERVQVYKSGDGNWYLAGASNQTGVQGWARCVAGTQSVYPSTEYSWNQYVGAKQMYYGGQYRTDTQTYNPAYSNCWMQGMTGKFSGSGESINVYPNPNSYHYLQGTSQQGDVGTWASCSNTRYPSTPQMFSQGQGGYGEVMLKAMSPLASHTCYLRYLTGKYQGSGEQVRIVNDGWKWSLRVRSHQGGIAGSAICTDYM